MIIELTRTYHPEWTEGLIMINDVILSRSIELPWKNNQRNISCIPEGIYPMVLRRSRRFSEHLLIQDVPDRDFILIHPANDARKELRGCIAPVLRYIGNGKGNYSRLALEGLMANMSRVHYQDCFIKVQEAYG